jgi:membrane protein YdbS with pleckstrin-like domain
MNCVARVSCSKPAAQLRSRRNLNRLNLNLRPMYNSFRQTCERLLRIPHDPAPPPGDEASTRIFRAAPNYYKYLLFIWALKTALAILGVLVALIIPIAVAAYTLARQGQAWALLLVSLPLLILILGVLACLFNLAVLRLEYEKRWYVVTDRSLRVREGVVTVREMTVNFANIQNISVSQGPIQRALGIADLRVDTAGGGGASSHNSHQPTENLHTAWFRGINNANEVRELIQQRLRLLKDSGLGDREELARPNLPAPESGFLPSPSLLAALVEVHAEARALHHTAGLSATPAG